MDGMKISKNEEMSFMKEKAISLVLQELMMKFINYKGCEASLF